MSESPRVWLDQQGRVIKYEGPPIGPNDEISPEASAALKQLVRLLARLVVEEELEKKRGNLLKRGEDT